MKTDFALQLKIAVYLGTHWVHWSPSLPWWPRSIPAGLYIKTMDWLWTMDPPETEILAQPTGTTKHFTNCHKSYPGGNFK